MKKFIMTLGLAGLLVSSAVTQAAGLGEYSKGYRIGQIPKFSIKGLMFKSGEGQMLVGNESTPLVITSTDSDGNTYRKVINPWYFSVSDKAMQAEIQKVVGDYVVIGYTQAKIKSPTVDTDYEVTSVEGLSKSPNKTCEASSWSSGSKSSGVRVGRIVKASLRGTFSNSWEITIQQGNSGNQFKAMSISKDKSLYDCAVAYLKSGKKVKITYDQSHLNLEKFMGTRDTSYDIVKIEPVKGLGE